MTTSPASRADRPSANNADAYARPEPPSEAVTLRDLIADSGPLPGDAALECLQRVAERLESQSGQLERSLGPSNIWIDDNGDIWLGSTESVRGSSSSSEHPNRESLDGLGRLLLYLTTANDSHLNGEADESSGPPGPVTRLAARLSSRDGVCYTSYAALAADAARLRNSPPDECQETREADIFGEHSQSSNTSPTESPQETNENEPEPPRDESESLDVAAPPPVETLVPADLDGNEGPSVVGDVEAASSSGQAGCLLAGLVVLALIGVLVWWIGT